MLYGIQFFSQFYKGFSKMHYVHMLIYITLLIGTHVMLDWIGGAFVLNNFQRDNPLIFGKGESKHIFPGPPKYFLNITSFHQDFELVVNIDIILSPMKF
jgi:hypothetical protein